MSAPVISARNLSLVFQTADRPVEALAKVNLEIAEGDFVSFIGPSGCGKTTLLRVIADLEQATSGAVSVNGSALQTGDAAMLADESAIRISHGKDAEVRVFDLQP